MDYTERTPEYYRAQQSSKDKFITLYGVPFMKVTPVPSLMHSKTIGAAVKRGDWLVVNLNTGDLTIYSKKRQLEDAKSGESLGTLLRKKLDAKPMPYFVLDVGTHQFELSTNAVEAVAQIEALVRKGVNILNSTLRCTNYNKGRALVYDNALSMNVYLIRVKSFITLAHDARNVSA